MAKGVSRKDLAVRMEAFGWLWHLEHGAGRDKDPKNQTHNPSEAMRQQMETMIFSTSRARTLLNAELRPKSPGPETFFDTLTSYRRMPIQPPTSTRCSKGSSQCT